MKAIKTNQMPIEIERRFIVKKSDWKFYTELSEEIKQGYLASDKEGWTIRVRITENEKAWITMKFKSSKISNYEFEYEIPIDQAEAIFEKTYAKVNKTRYTLNLPKGNWVVDCFHKENSPLIIAEVEMGSESEIIQKPNWCEIEITGEYQWSNASLAKTPISKWSIKDRLLAKSHRKGHSLL